MREKLAYGLGLLAGLWLVRNLYVILLVLPDEALQGGVYRIMFFHIPSWFTCFSLYFAAGIGCILYLIKKDMVYDTFAVATVEVGLAFTVIGLCTGSIWARNQWGIWWTWDARLTWALITCLIYFGYLMLRDTIDEPTARARQSSVFCVFAFVTVVINYKAIDWWRTQHPGAVLPFRQEGKMDPAMWSMLLQNFGVFLLLSAVLVIVRMRQEAAMREIEGLRRHAHAL